MKLQSLAYALLNALPLGATRAAIILRLLIPAAIAATSCFAYAGEELADAEIVAGVQKYLGDFYPAGLGTERIVLHFLDKSLPQHFHWKSVNNYPVVVVSRDKFIAEAKDEGQKQVCIAVTTKRVDKTFVQIGFVSAFHLVVLKDLGTVGVDERVGLYLCKRENKSIELVISGGDPFFEFFRIKSGFPENSIKIPLATKLLPLNEMLLKGTISAALKSAQADKPSVKRWGVVFIPDKTLSQDERWALLAASSKSGISAARFIDPEE